MLEIRPNQEEIQQRAYELFVERGCEQGRDVDDWLAAEQELKEIALDQMLRAEAARMQDDEVLLEPEVEERRVPKRAVAAGATPA